MVRGFLPAITAITATAATTAKAMTTAATATAHHDHYRLYLSLSCADTLTSAWAVETEVSGWVDGGGGG